MRRALSINGQKKTKDKKKDSNTNSNTLSFPINIPPPINLSAKEKDLSFCEGLLRKRRSDPKSYIQENTFKPELRQSYNGDSKSSQPPKTNPAILAPAILFHSPSECIRQAREGRLNTERDRLLHRRSIVLLIYWLSRLDPRAVSFLFNDNSHRHHSEHDRLHQALTSMMSPGGNSRCSGLYSYGLKIYQGLQIAKTTSFGQLFALGANFEESLALFWLDYAKEKKVELAREALSLMMPALRSAWCNCNCCKYRRLGVADLRDQLLRAYCEELDRFIMADGVIEEAEHHGDSRNRRFLYKSITLITTGILAARSRPVFDVLSAFSGLRFTDLPKGEGTNGDDDEPVDDSDSEGFIEYSTDDSEQGYEDEADLYEDCFHSLYNRHQEVDYQGSSVANEMLDFSDDDDLIEAADGELAIDEADIIGPIASASNRLSTASFLCRHRLGAIASDNNSGGNDNDDDGEQERQWIEDGKAVFQLFVSEILYNRLILAFWQEETRKQQELLIKEEEEEEEKKRRAKDKTTTKPAKKKSKRNKAIITARQRRDDFVQKPEKCDAGMHIQDCKNDTYGSEPANNEAVKESHHQEPSNQSNENQLEQLINEGLKEMALIDVDDLLPPGFEGITAYQLDDNLPPGFAYSIERIDDDCTESYNYLTSSLFGPALLNSIIG